VIISILAMLAIIPYLALQLQAITVSFNVLTDGALGDSSKLGQTFFLTFLLIVFTIIFGTRKLDITEHRPGLMNAIAFESIIKVIAFVLIGGFCLLAIKNASANENLIRYTLGQTNILEKGVNSDFFVQTLLAFCAMLCLPRQFHVTFVEYHHPKDLSYASWIVPIYLLIFAVLALPIVAVGTQWLAQSNIPPDAYVVGIPLASEQNWLALLVFIGGLSAGTGMVIVASTTLSTMLSNDIVLPLYVYRKRFQNFSEGELQKAILLIRRFLIIFILCMAFLFYIWIEGTQSLANIGLLAFSLVAHFAPAILFGIYWKAASKASVLIGLAVGLFIWLAYFLSAYKMGTGIWLNFQAIGFFGYSVLTESTLLSLTAHLISFIIATYVFKPGLNQRIQAHLFTQSQSEKARYRDASISESIAVKELFTLASSIVGKKRAQESFIAWLDDGTKLDATDANASSDLIQNTELMLSGVIGAPSARELVRSLLKDRKTFSGDIASLIGSTADAVRFNRVLTEQVLDNIGQGISVVDIEKRIIAWNDSYLELMQYPEGFIYQGKPLHEIIRFNAKRGYCGPGEIEDHVKKRLSHLSQGTGYRFERYRDDGTILDIRGNPISGGRYVTTYSDITEYKNTQYALERANEGLEQRVNRRTNQLQMAKAEAEQATKSKTRFLAAASHDLLQPFNAAKLFTAVLESDSSLNVDQAGLVKSLSASLLSAEDILSVLIEISKLDRNKLGADFTEFPLQEIFSSLDTQFTAIAKRKNLELRVRATDIIVRSDRKLLHRLLQNFVSNAIRYTESGGVLVGARKRLSAEGQSAALVCVYDTGIGIPKNQQLEVFDEFKRIDNTVNFDEETALGLGLAISKRIAGLLNSNIELESRLEQGSVFSINVEMTNQTSELKTVAHQQTTLITEENLDPKINDLYILAVDNEIKITDAMYALLSKWSQHVYLANSLNEARALLKNGLIPDIVFADYHLDDNETGLEVLSLLKNSDCEKVIVTANHSSSLEEQISESSYQLLHKPVAAQDILNVLTARIKNQ